MPAYHVALRRLGLARDVDERTVRRAYARELKLIDQDSDAAGFQTLREAYDAALDYARTRAAGGFVWLDDSDDEEEKPGLVADSSAADIPSPPADGHLVSLQEGAQETGDSPVGPKVVADTFPLAFPVEEGDADVPSPPGRHNTVGMTRLLPPDIPDVSPEVLATAVRDELLHALLAAPLSLSRTDELMVRALNDERLVMLDARREFEWLVAKRLADGWLPGNEALLTIAVKRFGWENDRRRLHDAGTCIDVAVNELHAFNNLDPAERSRLLDVIRLLRTTSHPEFTILQANLTTLREISHNYPNLLPLITNNHNVVFWLGMGEGIPDAPAARAVEPRLKGALRPVLMWLVILALAGQVISHFFGH